MAILNPGCGFDARCVNLISSASELSYFLQPHSYNHKSSVSGNTLQLNYFKLGVRASLAGTSKLASGLGTRTEARQCLELKRSAQNRMVI